MPQTTTQQMGEAHETYLAEITQGAKTKASGSQWTEQGDTRNHHDLAFALRMDGKSTRGKSISVTLDMIAKIREQAHGERPGLGLRWYGSDDLRVVLEDWVAVPGADFEEMLIAARQLKELEAAGVTLDRFLVLGDDLNRARESLAAAMKMIAGRSSEIDVLAARLQGGAAGTEPQRQVPGYIPALPWTVVILQHQVDRTVTSAVRFDDEGRQYPVEVWETRVERSFGSSNRPRIIVNQVVRDHCDVYLNGTLKNRAWSERPDMEIG